MNNIEKNNVQQHDHLIRLFTETLESAQHGSGIQILWPCPEDRVSLIHWVDRAGGTFCQPPGVRTQRQRSTQETKTATYQDTILPEFDH